MMGIGPALFEAVRFADGKILTNSFAEYRVPRFKDMPKIDVQLVDNRDIPSTGAGETPLIAVAPAISNAIFAATGLRIRSMPIKCSQRPFRLIPWGDAPHENDEVRVPPSSVLIPPSLAAQAHISRHAVKGGTGQGFARVRQGRSRPRSSRTTTRRAPGTKEMSTMDRRLPNDVKDYLRLLDLHRVDYPLAIFARAESWSTPHGKRSGNQAQGKIASRAKPESTRKPILSERRRVSELIRTASSTCSGVAVV